jgi:hypothetical protein
MNKEIQAYNDSLAEGDTIICNQLAAEINRHLPEAQSKIWHRHPVWFLEGNPIVGYSKLKDSVRLLFWSGQKKIHLSSHPSLFRDSLILSSLYL